MTDLINVLPDFSTSPYSHLLPSLSRNLITTSDLVSLDASDIAKRAQLPPVEVAKLSNAILEALHNQLGVGESKDDTEVTELNRSRLQTCEAAAISTLDEGLDDVLNGGIPAGYLTEFTGESGAGKTQLLLTLLLSAQLPAPRGLSKSAVYISTEAALSTSRLHQLLHLHPLLSDLPQNTKPSLSRILSIQTPDLESQEHIVRYQLPVAIKRQNVGLVVIDSMASNYRAEFGHADKRHPEDSGRRIGRAMADRRSQLVQLGAFLRDLARTEHIAIIVSNQVADRLAPTYDSQPSSTPGITPDPLALDHQLRWFSGWGDQQYDVLGLKTPSLGLVWTNQIAARIALIKSQTSSREGKTKRWFRVVFASWTAPTSQKGVEYEITTAGIKANLEVSAAETKTTPNEAV